MNRIIYFFAMACIALAQDTPADTTKPETRRYSIGARIGYDVTRLFDTNTTTASTTSPIADYTYLGSSHSGKRILAALGEYRLTDHISIAVEFTRHQAEYTQVTQIRSGKTDPNSSTDKRQVTTVTQDTRANYWEMPFLARYYNVTNRYKLSRGFVTGGLTYRHIGNIRTSNATQNADGSTAYDETPAATDRTNQLGFVAGIGARFLDEFKINAMPEVRYTRWFGETFHGPSYRSATNQIEIGLSVTF
jgi:hypothetical protein